MQTPRKIGSRKSFFLRRVAPADFYLHSSEILGGGATRGSISNEMELLGEPEFKKFDRVVAEEMTPSDQIQTLSSASVLVGQHGAGLSHMMWMPRGSSVVEITNPELTPGQRETYRPMAAALGHRYVQVEAQSNRTGPVDIGKVLDALKF